MPTNASLGKGSTTPGERLGPSGKGGADAASTMDATVPFPSVKLRPACNPAWEQTFMAVHAHPFPMGPDRAPRRATDERQLDHAALVSYAHELLAARGYAPRHVGQLLYMLPSIVEAALAGTNAWALTRVVTLLSPYVVSGSEWQGYVLLPKHRYVRAVTPSLPPPEVLDGRLSVRKWRREGVSSA